MPISLPQQQNTSGLPAAVADADITDLIALSPEALLRDPGLLLIPDESTWPARALKYARAGADTYDAIGFRFVAANPCKQGQPLQTRAGMQLERTQEERSLQDEAIERIRDQQPLLRHRPIGLPSRPLSVNVMHDRGLLHLIEEVETTGRPRHDSWVFPLSSPPPMVLNNARPADAPLIGAQRQQLDIPGANWLSLFTLIERGAFLRMQDRRSALVRELQPDRFYAFISHRWLTPTHPDPEAKQARFIAWQLVAALCSSVRVAHTRGRTEPRRYNDQLQCIVGLAGTPLVEALIVNVLRPALDDDRLVQAAAEVASLDALMRAGGITQADTDQRLETLRALISERPVLRTLVERVFLWYDYASLPQQPRSAEDEALFREHLQYLLAVQAVSHTLVLLDEPVDYLTRAWCTLEALFAKHEVRLSETLVGSARRTTREGQTERYFETLLIDHPHVVWRALLDTEVLHVQSAADCLRRLQLAATDPRDLPYIYDRLCNLHAPNSVHIDPSELVTGVFPLPVVNDGNDALAPTHKGRSTVRPVQRSEAFTIDWSAALHLQSYRQHSNTAQLPDSVPPFALLDPLAEGHQACHIAIIANCETEALLLGRWVLTNGVQLGQMLDQVTVVSMSWLASDVAPVGQLVHGNLRAHAIHAQLWMVVAFADRFDSCPITAALTETLLECAIPYFEMKIDQTTDNVSVVTSPPQANRPRAREDAHRFRLVRITDEPFPIHVGGLFQAHVPQSLVTP